MEEGPAATRVHCRLDELLVARGMTLTKLSEATGITLANLSILKTDKARAIRFSTLVAVCDALHCQPGDLFTLVPDAGKPGEAEPEGAF